MKSRRFACAVLTLILICSLVLTGCGNQNDLTGITVTYVTSPLNVPSIVEKNHGIFAPDQGFLPRYHHGVYHGHMVVSAGCSNTSLLPRFGNPCEVVLVRLVPQFSTRSR